jgi:hypothetical protein
MNESDPATCPATKQGDTANGPVTVQCTKTPGHVQAGDARHEGRTGRPPGMPVYWVD